MRKNCLGSSLLLRSLIDSRIICRRPSACKQQLVFRSFNPIDLLDGQQNLFFSDFHKETGDVGIRLINLYCAVHEGRRQTSGIPPSLVPDRS